jgi:hypothetical protein
MWRLEWQRFPSFLKLREAFRGRPCIYLQTDPSELVLRVGETGDPWARYRGGTAWALEAAGHGSGNLYFAAPAPADERERRRLESSLISDLAPKYNNMQSIQRADGYEHAGQVPAGVHAARSNNRLEPTIASSPSEIGAARRRDGSGDRGSSERR